ncbi:hypothetical protein [Streptomyces rishiriensis]|uniref:DUF3558 domain-containing protein n=1 Tax=Streptomyces rishiriensis TaxID=68264 RepID=A0ABU0NJA1_STRRH|nr:hypothetical protein [Streptomyces rishiriensis]MDQ0579194.1 hypothetical protein [Streptomyces rishiriensis]
MSTPPQPPQQPEQPSDAPAQPSAYPYPNPQSPAPGGPLGFPPAAPATQVDRPSVYAQPTLVGQPAPAQPVNPYLQQGPYPVVGPPPGSGSGGGGAGKAVLWAAAGAVLASAAWAAGLFLVGAEADPDLRGYVAPSNLCNSTDYSSFKEEYPDNDSSPTHNSLKDDALDEGLCSISLKKDTSSYADAYLYSQLDLHKETDPGPEFTAAWKNYADSHTGYDVDTVTGIGDEAYLVSNDTTSGSSSGSLYATLAVRDGWVTYTMSYSAYYSSYDDDTDPPSLEEVTGYLKTDTRTTLEDLRD